MHKIMFHLLRIFSSATSGLIAFLSLHFKRRAFIVINCPGDANATIVTNALRYGQENSGTVTVVADDTDVAMMLFHHWEVSMQDIYFLENRRNKVWSVKVACTRIISINEHLLFIHSW